MPKPGAAYKLIGDAEVERDTPPDTAEIARCVG
jgi:hypothetical protein